MKKRLRSGFCMFLSFLVLCTLLVFTAGHAAAAGDAVENTTAGELEQVFTNNSLPDSFSELKITGKLNRKDLKFLAGYLKAVESLNLAGAEFEDPYATGRGDDVFFPNVLKDNAGLQVSLNKIYFPQKIDAVENGSFAGYKNLEEIYFDTGLKKIAHFAFYTCTALKKVQFPDTLQLIEKNAFDECTALEEVHFPDTLEVIEDSAFAKCSNLKYLQALGVKTIGKKAFENCINLEFVRIPRCVTLKGGAFYNNEKLKLISMPSVMQMDESAFYSCTELHVIFMNDNQPVVEDDTVFHGCSPDETPIIVFLPCKIKNLDAHDLNGFPDNIEKSYYPKGFRFGKTTYKVAVSETIDLDYTLVSEEGQKVNEIIKNYIDWLLQWNIEESDDIISLEKGAATGKKAGTATVSLDFHEAFDVEKATCKVEVSKKTNPPNPKPDPGPKPNPNPNPSPDPDPWKNPYDDVFEKDWYYDEALYDYYNDLMKGTADRIFSPKTPTTRGMVVTILGRIEKIDEDDYQKDSFEDVSGSAYYAPYVAWAKENNIAKGVTEELFQPSRACTREEIAVLIDRYMRFKCITVAQNSQAAKFADDVKIAGYAREAVYTLAANKILLGKENNLFAPKDPALRREMAVIIYRVHQLTVTD